MAVKPCPGVEDRSCGESIPAIRTRCEGCQTEHRRLARRAHNRSAYLKRQAEQQEKGRARHREKQEKEDRRIARRVAVWEIREEEKAETRGGFYRFTLPENLPDDLRPSELPSSVFRGVRAARRERIMPMVPAIKEGLLQRAKARARKRSTGPTNAEPQRNAQSRWGDMAAPRTPYRGPAQPASAGAAGETVTEILDRMSREAKRTRTGSGTGTGTGKRRGRPRMTESEKLWHRIKQAQALYYLIEHEGRGYDVAWYELHPDSSATRENAALAAKREVKWFKARYLSKTKAVILKTGLYDFEFFIRPIKEGLAATRFVRGKLTDLPDWRARREALKMLMIGLQLAMLDGFRSGPRAVGGVLQDAPIATAADVPPRGEDDDDAYALRRFKAEGIFVRHRVEGLPLEDCWRAVNPDSTANPETARKEAARLLDWFEKRFGSPLLQRLIAEGLDNATVLDGIDDLLNATKVSGAPDWIIRHHGRHLLMVLHGFHHRNPQNVPERGFSAGNLLPAAEREALQAGREPPESPAAEQEQGREREPLPEQLRAHRIKTLIFLSSRGMPPERCWAVAYPDEAGVSREKARELVDAEIEWGRRNDPIPMKALMVLRGRDTYFLMADLKTQKEAAGASVLIGKKGKLVRRYDKTSTVPDYGVSMKAWRQWQVIYTAGTRPQLAFCAGAKRYW